MHFFAGRHDPRASQVLDRDTTNPAFEIFFEQHQRKLLLARGAQRYLAKANYQLARLGYVHRLYPSARFVIPVREPQAHVRSLLTQNRRFVRMHAEDAAVGAHMARVGHFEFGPQKRVFHLGDDAAATAISADFAHGDDASAYARQWAAQYGHALEKLQGDADLATACLWVDFDQLCANPSAQLERVARHVGLDAAETRQLVERWTPRISAPPSSAPADAAQRETVERLTAPVWQAVQSWIERPARH